MMPLLSVEEKEKSSIEIFVRWDKNAQQKTQHKVLSCVIPHKTGTESFHSIYCEACLFC